MPYIPHTDHDIQSMLATIGVNQIEDLFDEIPENLKIDTLKQVPEGINEMAASRLLYERATRDRRGACFIGAGAYDHHIPAAVWEITGRGEFLTAYTPYQAEASQGTLQLLYEYQTMMSSLMGLDVSNASLYDGASALAEAVLMALRSQRKNKSRKVLYIGSLHPIYRDVVNTIVQTQGIELVAIPFDEKTGVVEQTTLKQFESDPFAALVISQPNFFGCIEDVDHLTNWAHSQDALVVGVVNPIAVTVLKEPGCWGDEGADIACGDGQPLGVPLASGGPYYGFLCCKQNLVRQLPGRLIGRTTDQNGQEGYALTLQAREQHIRRSKATSNICTNQGLAVTASTIHMSLLGFDGLQQAGQVCHDHLVYLIDQLTQLKGVEKVFVSPCFHEVVLRFETPIKEVLNALLAHKIQGGFEIGKLFPQYNDCLLICTTEMQTKDDIDQYTNILSKLT